MKGGRNLRIPNQFLYMQLHMLGIQACLLYLLEKCPKLSTQGPLATLPEIHNYSPPSHLHHLLLPSPLLVIALVLSSMSLVSMSISSPLVLFPTPSIVLLFLPLPVMSLKTFLLDTKLICDVLMNGIFMSSFKTNTLLDLLPYQL